MYSNFNYFNYGLLFLVLAAIVNTNRVPYGYSTQSSHGYNYWPSDDRDIWNNEVKIPNYNVQTNEILDNNYQTNEKVRVQVYYETLCPDCVRGSTQLVKTVEKLAPYLNIKTYPYGNAQTFDDGSGHITFKCQHGPKECYGNKLHACAIDSIGNETSAIIFNVCMIQFGSDNQAADKCGQLLGVDSTGIKACAAGERGTQLLKYYGEESKKAGFRHVPYVLINGIESDEHNLMQNVCKAFINPPPECQGYLSSSVLGFL